MGRIITRRSRDYPKIDWGDGYRYWRMKALLNNGDTAINPTEWEFYEDDEVSTNSGVTLTSSYSWNYSVLIDGSLTDGSYASTYDWDESDFYLQFDFGEAKEITKFRHANRSISATCISEFTLQKSNDLREWKTASRTTGLTYPGYQTWSAFISV